MVFKSRVRLLAPLAVILLVLVGSCSDGTSPPAESLKIMKTPTDDGDNQSWGTAHNMPLPLRVLVLNHGAPMAGVTVTWSVDSGNGYIAPLIPVTGDDGISTARWGMSTRVGIHHAKATLEGAEGSPVVFTATAIPNLPYSVRIASGDGQTAVVGTQLAEPLVVYVGDQFDNPFYGQAIEWVITQGEGTISPVLTVSDDAGLAKTFLTLGPNPGTVTVLARFPGAESGPMATFTATATAGP
jgi:hypothetical protein